MKDAAAEMLDRTVSAMRARMKVQPKIGLILGSGLGSLADRCESAVSMPFVELEGYPKPTVVGHSGRVVAGMLAGKPVLAQAGRGHLYEGNPVSTVAFPVRAMKALGVETLIITNAAGGIRAGFRPGDFMLISDHLNMMGVNPLTGPNDDTVGPRFLDMTSAYDASLRTKARDAGKRLGIPLQEGVYCALMGPTYETPAEIRMLRTLGADAVGMSTVPEVIAARHRGVKVLGISFISNAAAGMSGQPLSHEEVTAEADKARPKFEQLLMEIISSL
jgi:purine-nucleoside phosphorylase